MRETQNAAVDVKSKHIRSSGVILLLRTYQCNFHTYEFSFGFVHQGEVSKQKLLIFCYQRAFKCRLLKNLTFQPSKKLISLFQHTISQLTLYFICYFSHHNQYYLFMEKINEYSKNIRLRNIFKNFLLKKKNKKTNFFDNIMFGDYFFLLLNFMFLRIVLL